VGCRPPLSVIGRWSNEIATACAAGLSKPNHAIQAAFFRVQAAEVSANSSVSGGGSSSMDLMGAGLGGNAVPEFITETTGLHIMHVACYKSPSTVTLSSHKLVLEEVKARLQEHSLFALLLQIYLAHYSPVMERLAKFCKLPLRQNGVSAARACSSAKDADANDAAGPLAIMFLSVSSKRMHSTTNSL
jgi:hypothetical protein